MFGDLVVLPYLILGLHRGGSGPSSRCRLSLVWFPGENCQGIILVWCGSSGPSIWISTRVACAPHVALVLGFNFG